MSATLDAINELRRKHGSLPIQSIGGLYDDEGYTNDNDLGTLTGAFGLGAASMANNTLVGGLGYGLANLGRGVEWISPYSGEGISENNRGLLRLLGYSDEEVNKMAPYEDSWITSGAKNVLSAQNAVDDWIKEQRYDLLGDNPTMGARVSEGAGSSIGYMLSMLATRANPLLAAAVGGVGEALSEAGGFMGDAYREGQYDKGAISAANKGFAANALLNTGLNIALSPFGGLAGKIENPVGRYVVGTGQEVLNEMLQEPSQNVIEQAAKNSLNNQTGFLSELGESVKQWPEMFAQIAPEVAGSTLLTQALLAPLGIKGNINYNNALSEAKGRLSSLGEQLNSITAQDEEATKLRDDYQKLIEQIGKLGYENPKGLNQSLTHLSNLENALANYGKSAEEIKTEKQAEAVEAVIQNAAAQEPVVQPEQVQPTAPIVTPTKSPVSENDTQIGFGNVDMFDPNVPKEQAPKAAPKRIEVGEAPEIATGTSTLSPIPSEPAANRNVVRIRTMKGTEVDARYRVIEVDDLITSTNDNGSPNPNYPQELQPRQRDRSASQQQIDKIARTLDPELLGENRLASDGAPVVGPDRVVESGNGRTIAIRNAYKWGRADNYREWVINNAARFGINPDYVANMKNPVLVRERITEVDRVKFTSEANESSIATMSASEHALDDAKLITDDILSTYDPEKSFEGNGLFIVSVISRMPSNEKGDLIQKNGLPSKSGIERIRNALVARAYNDPSILDRLSELPDDDVKNVSNALIQAAPQMAVMENSNIRKGLSIRDDIMKAVNIYSSLRKNGKKVAEYLSTIDMFDTDITPEARKLLKFFDDNKRSPKRMAEGLINYANGVLNEAREGQNVLFADSMRNKGQILNEAIKMAEDGIDTGKDLSPEEQLRQNIKQQILDVGRSEDEAEAVSHVFMAGNKFFAKYTGLTLDDVVKSDNINFFYSPHLEATNEKGEVIGEVKAQTEFWPERRNMFGDVEQEAKTIIKVSQMTDKSSIVHELGHVFLKKFQRLAQTGQLKGLAKQDWKTLLKAYGISEIDFNNMSDEDRMAWLDTNEKFATDFERYLRTGEVPNSKLKHVFEAFKRWLTEIYHSIKDIKYVGADGLEHEFDLSPEIKEIFDHILGDNNESEVNNQAIIGKKNSIERDLISNAGKNFITPEQIERLNQRAFHGTGHVMEDNEFKLDKMGTGEGGQSFGYGAYLAESTAVPQAYRKYGLSSYKIPMQITMKDGETYTPNNLDTRSSMGDHLQALFSDIVYEIRDKNPNLSSSEYIEKRKRGLKDLIEIDKRRLKEVKQKIKDGIGKRHSNEQSLQNIKDLIQYSREKLALLYNIKEIQIGDFFRGNVYEFDGIPENDELLDWDAPLDEQPPKIRDALSRLVRALGRFGYAKDEILGDSAFTENKDSIATGETIYQNIANALGYWSNERNTRPNPLLWGKIIDRADKAASMLLNKYGIPGLRYWDGQSRTRKTGTHNFVIWNTETLKMIGLSEDSDEDAKRYFQNGGSWQNRLFDDNGEPQVYNQVVGKEAARALDEKEGVTYRMDNLAIAEKMTAAGKDAKTIRLATGWEKGTDREWRWEIMDGEINLDAKPLEERGKYNTPLYELTSLLKNQDLYTAYPSLKNIRIAFEWMDRNTGASYDKEQNLIKLNAAVFTEIGGINDDALKKLENSPEYQAFIAECNKLLDEAKTRGWEKVTIDRELAAFKRNSPIWREHEKLQKTNQGIKKLNQKTFANIGKSVLIHEIQHAIQDIEGFASGGSPEKFNNNKISLEKLQKQLEWREKLLKDFPNDEHQEDESERTNLEQEIAKLKEQIEEVEENGLDGMVKVNDKLYEDTYDAYRHLAGEAEARNVQTRKDFTEEQRRNTLLAETLDVDRDRLIERYNQIGAKRKQEMDKALQETRPDMSEEQRADAIAENDKRINSEEQIEAVRRQYKGTDKWLKAPNGKKSNLSEHQWLQVRTPNFKKWFGDWEIAHTVKTVRDYLDNSEAVGSITGEEFAKTDTPLVDRVMDFYSKTGNTTVHNEELGDVTLDRRGIKDSMGHGLGKEKSAAFALVPDVIKHGFIYDRQNSWKGRKYNTATLIANVKIGDKDYVCEVVVKKSENKQGFYLHEVEIKENLDSVFKTAPNGTPSRSRLIISDYAQQANEVSKVVDENGEPLVVWHGNPNSKLDIAHLLDTGKEKWELPFSVFRTDSGEGKIEHGAFFHKQPTIEYGHPVSLFLNMKNPFFTEEVITRELAGELQNEGYDGVIRKNVGLATEANAEYVVFSPEQIKSATDNISTFDGNNPDIYYQAFSVRQSLLQRLNDWLRGKDIEEIAKAGLPISATNIKVGFENEETERRYKEAEIGVPEPTVQQKVKRFTTRLFKSLRGDFPELAGNREFDFAREEFRKLGRAKSAQIHKAMKTFTENLGNLSERQRDLFGRMRLLDDLMWRKSQVPDAELPFGFDDETLKKEHEKFTKLIQNEPGVQKAIQAEEQTMREISREFVELAGQLGLNLDGVFRNPHYYRHTILEYASMAARSTRGARQADSKFGGTLQDAIDEKLNEIKNRSFMKKYKGSALDINMNYTQAQGEVRAQMLMDIETMRTLLAIKEHYDKAPELRDALKKAFTPPKDGNERHNQGEGANISDIIPEGYALYNPAGSRLIQSANTAAENVLAMAIDDAAEESGLPLDEIISSMGAAGEEFLNQLWIIPKEIKETLRNMSKGRDRGLLGNTAKAITTAWKKLVLFSPTRNLKYNFRNFTGDLDAVIAGNPNALKFFGQAVKELTAHFTKNKTTQDLKDYMARSGGIYVDSMGFSDNEIKELQNMAEILKDENASIPKKGWNLVKKFFANEVAFTEWREHLLRYAAYLAYKQDMDENNGTPSTWGASLKNEVMALSDNRDKAFKMSNELLGAYDQVSNTGKQLREMLIPFYS